MPESLQTQMENLRLSITGLEAQRTTLGDKIVDPALAALRQQLQLLEQQVAVQAAPIEERRMVTILFLDIVGSTSLAEKLDPEEWRQVISKVHNALGETITAHHGTVAQYLGDGLLAFFGSREAGENDPENAIRAALASHATVASLNIAENLQLRAGIHTGLVVVGELGDTSHKEFTASGDAMNLAARLQSAAPPDGTLISHDTYHYVRGIFDLTPQPPLTVKGKKDPVQTYLVRRAKARPFLSVSRGVAGIETRTIGREQEMQALQAAYLRAYAGHGVVWAQLVGEPGVGKSRLIVDMTDWIDLRPEDTWLLRARAFPDDANQPFALVRRMWFDRFQIAEDAPLPNAEAKWVERFKEYYHQDDREEAAHSLGLLVGLPFQDSPHIKGMRDDPSQVKGRAVVVSRELVKSVRQESPLVLLLEDLQWTDAASWDYLTEVYLDGSSDLQSNGLFILGAARPEWHPPEMLANLFASSQSVEVSGNTWGTQISLSPLTNQAIQLLAQELLQRASNVPKDVIDLLVERSEGVPYFTEEIINWFIDHRILETHEELWSFLPERLKEQPLPPTLQHLLLTRLGNLSQSERAALQRGAIFGRRFWTGGVEALGIPSGEETLGHLQPRGFVEIQPDSAFQGETEWSFHHNLLQEVTYESVLKRERAALHKIAASWLEQQARKADRLDEFAGLLGDHYERSGELSTAADWYLRSGKRAFSQGAPREAIKFFTRALELLPPIDLDRRWQATLGMEEAHNVVGEALLWKTDLANCLELAQALDNDDYIAEVYFHQAVFGLHTGDYHMIDQASRAALRASQRCGNKSIEAKALIMTAVARQHWGDNSTATKIISEAVQMARRQDDESALVFVLFRAAFCYGETGYFDGWYPLYIELIELTHRLGDRVHEAMALGNFGSAYSEHGLYKQGRAILEQAIQINRSIGARRPLAYNLLNLAGNYRHTGDLRKSIHYLEQASEMISVTQDIRAKNYILTGFGKVALETDDLPAAARYFSEACNLASNHDMPALECEDSIGIAACELRQGHLERAQQLNFAAWAFIKEHSWHGMGDPAWAFVTCIEIFDALGDNENYDAMLESAYQSLMELAGRKSNPVWRQSFLENLPENRALVEMWERRKGQIAQS